MSIARSPSVPTTMGSVIVWSPMRSSAVSMVLGMDGPPFWAGRQDGVVLSDAVACFAAGT